MINSHDFLAVRRTHDIDEQTEPTFCPKPRWGSPQYSDAFVDWFVDHIEGDPGFLDDARRRYYEMSRRR